LNGEIERDFHAGGGACRDKPPKVIQASKLRMDGVMPTLM